MELDHGTTDSHSSLNTRAEAEISLRDSRLHVLSNTAMAGSGNATARIYSNYSSWGSETIEMTFDYYRSVDSMGGKCKVYGYIRDPDGAIEKKEMEDLSTGADGNTVKDVEFDLSDSGQYEVGIEAYAESSTAGSVSYADAFNRETYIIGDRHRIEVNDFQFTIK